ncbi:beta-N-acetylhexosaminidase [Flavobacteriaceae bacterium UJ101]|nr:beta-N-acetylhexosaminidase [Flavobacteriaceae bacterium UJ101]
MKVIKYTYLFLFLTAFLFTSCGAQEKNVTENQKLKIRSQESETKDQKLITYNPNPTIQNTLVLAVEKTNEYLPLLENKQIGIVTNQTGMLKQQHLVDFLLSKGIDVTTIFSPEHGFRGKADAGEKVKNGRDLKTGLPIISLYGKNKKPTAAQLANVDILLFDIQDVGVRFYTYISTLHYIMEAAAEQHKKVIVLDRPNPNAHYIDGPVLEKGNESFIGMHPVPVVYGMTIGEYAQMINGEKWLKNNVQADLTVIKMDHYTHQTSYDLPIKPSPNLPNAQSISLYPSLCFFEGTTVSVGRGTDFPFQVYGAPYLKGDFQFIPKPNEGAKHPKNQGKTNYGKDLRSYPKMNRLHLSWLIEAREQNRPLPNAFWLKNGFIHLLAGTKKLKQQIDQGMSEEQIRASWQPGLEQFKRIRSQYLLYP